MRKTICACIALTLALSAATVTAEDKQTFLLTTDGKAAYCEGTPYINSDNAAMVPVRFFVQNLHMPVDFKGDDIVIRGENAAVTVKRGSRDMLINGAAAEADAAPEYDGKYIYVPIRSVCSALGYDVEWNDKMNSINICENKGGAAGAEVSFEQADAYARAGASEIGDIRVESLNTNGEDYIGDREKHVFAFIMGNERTKAGSGAYRCWNNAGRDEAHNPDNAYPDGKRDIASVYYPSIGLYDVSDPDYAEYRMQLMKMTYIDSASFYTIPNDEWYKGVLRNVIVPLLDKYDIKGCLRLSSSNYNSMSEDDSWKKVFFDEIEEYIEIFGDSQLLVDGRPVVTIFDSAGLNASDLTEWKAGYEEGTAPFVMRWLINTFNDDVKAGYDGMYDWVSTDGNRSGFQFPIKQQPFSYYTNVQFAKYHHVLDLIRAKNILDTNTIDEWAAYYGDSVSPGFDSKGVWGWGSTPTKVERGDNGEVYEFKWQYAVLNRYPMVCIPTWDDWGEASGIEPTLEYGNKYLEITRKYAAEYKGIQANTADLSLPDRIYKIRKTVSDTEINLAMDKASNLIAQGKFDEAQKIVDPYAEELEICDVNTLFNYPNTAVTQIDYVSDEVVRKDGTVPSVDEIGNVIYTPAEDTFVRDGASRSSNYGDATALTIKNSTSGMNRKILIKFDTSDKRLSSVGSARLRLYISSLGRDERNICVYSTSSDWQEDEVTWQTAPEPDEMYGTILTPASMDKKWVEVDVTKLVRESYGGVFSIMLINNGPSSEKNQLSFGSRELSGKEPQLIIR